MSISVSWFFLKLEPSSNLIRYSITELFIHFCIPVWQKHFKVPLDRWFSTVQYRDIQVSVFISC
jgi:hypothetical protein